jgi:hypothetical protein
MVPVTIGLSSTRSTKIRIGVGSANSFSFYLPAQGCIEDLVTGGGYSVLVENNKSIGKNVIIPKFESVVANFPNNMGDVSTIRINYKEINPTDIADLNVIPNGQFNPCYPNSSAINNYLSTYTNYMSSVNSSPSLKRTFELGGLPATNYTINDGLISFSVRVSSQGVKSYLTFSNLKDRVVELDSSFTEFQFQQFYRNLGRGSRINSAQKNTIYESAEQVLIR